jgi:UDP-glucose 4-epimerase
VSYDIYFVRRDPGQSFEDALDAAEESFEGDPGPLSPVELEQWDAVLPVAREVLGDVDEFGNETTRELSDPTTGIQLSLFNGEMAIHVPLADYGGQSEDVMSRVHDLARAVERVTGLAVPVILGERRIGDPAALVSDASKARETFDWQPKISDLDEIVRTAWAWHQRSPPVPI